MALFDVFRQRALARSPVILEDAALLDPREFRRLRGGQTRGVAHLTHHELSAVALPPVEDVQVLARLLGVKCPYQRGAVAREVHEVRAEERIYHGLRGIRARHVSSRVRRCRDAARCSATYVVTLPKRNRIPADSPHARGVRGARGRTAAVRHKRHPDTTPRGDEYERRGRFARLTYAAVARQRFALC